MCPLDVLMEIDGRVRAEGLDDSAPQVAHRQGHASELALIQTAQDPVDHVFLEQLDVMERLAPRVGELDMDDAAVVGDAGPLDEPTFLDAINEAGRVRHRHAEQFRDAAHRHRAVAVEHRHQVKMRHAHVRAVHPLAAQAAQFGKRLAEVGDDLVLGILRRSDSSHRVKYSYSVTILSTPKIVSVWKVVGCRMVAIPWRDHALRPDDRAPAGP